MTNDHGLWVEKYRPTILENYLGNPDLKEKLQECIDSQDLPHLLFNGPPGTGKTTAAKILTNNIESDVLFINASSENGIDVIRDKITNFASTRSFSNKKIVVLDECLDKDTLVWVCDKDDPENIQTIPISQVDDTKHLVYSFNTETDQHETVEFVKLDKGLHDVWEIEFEDGSKVICTTGHKWYCEYEGLVGVYRTDQLSEIGHILTA